MPPGALRIFVLSHTRLRVITHRSSCYHTPESVSERRFLVDNQALADAPKMRNSFLTYLTDSRGPSVAARYCRGEETSVGLRPKHLLAAPPSAAQPDMDRASGAKARHWSGGSAPEPPGYLKPDEAFQQGRAGLATSTRSRRLLSFTHDRVTFVYT